MDLAEAIEYHQAALEIFINSHPHRSTSLNNLADSLLIRFERHGRAADLDEAIKHHRAALELCPEGHPDRSAALKNFASSFLSRFQKFGLMDDLEECMQLFERATAHRFSSLTMRLKIADRWASLARIHSRHSTSRAYKVTMLLLQHALIFSPILHAQHDFLS
ncbi:uncharacterized protein FOMMEDRAFT_158091 [Fomitiporia mediterranea MF3/22]|uniref:uncharacterized protein n=1 Tax=Fomitiporia mediterranea (strain MF3/22) TaxID=694068 RepID=UPI0004408591|nr:uncharacterized protein FOMMEDRAFT_158091 [Fomitiporia mediterranea MF3/22]EJD00970.1 hypothetical protein FOMMEDRAFT_158091 [Fomitiporia mediterranea MF3/22]